MRQESPRYTNSLESQRRIRKGDGRGKVAAMYLSNVDATDNEMALAQILDHEGYSIIPQPDFVNVPLPDDFE